MIGAYSVDNASLDLWWILVFGLLGYALRKLDFDLSPLVLAVVLGPRMEKHLREALFLSRGDFGTFVGSPISIAIWVAGFIFLFGGPLLRLVQRRARGTTEMELG